MVAVGWVIASREVIVGVDSKAALQYLEARQIGALVTGDVIGAAQIAVTRAAFAAAMGPVPSAAMDPVAQAVTDQTALQSEARHAARLEDERAEDELTSDQSADALGRALRGIRDAHRDVWPF